MANETKQCPFCGEEILLIAKKCKHCGEFLDGSATLSDGSKTQNNQEEKIVWEGHPSHFYYLGNYIIGGILTPFLGLGLIIIFWALLDKKSTIYTITSRRVKSKRGIFSCTTREVTIKDIKVINLKQSIIEKLFDLGTIEVGSAGTAGIEVIFYGIAQVPEVKNMISEQKDRMN